jgi:glycosyltransferase involved in cell wall biosynthesis
MKKILVVMPVFNREEYVARAIDSVLNQTYKNFDLVIVDDYSTDRSLEIINFYKKDPRVKIIQNPYNAGCFYSKNIGIKFMESGQYDVFTTHDSDDFSDSTRFEKMIKEFEDESLLCLLSTEMRIGENIPKWYGSIIRATPGHCFYSKKAFKFFGYFDNALTSADVDYINRVQFFCKQFEMFKFKISEELLYYADTTAKDNMHLEYDEKTRIAYDQKSLIEVQKMAEDRNFYRNFFEIQDSVKIKK